MDASFDSDGKVVTDFGAVPFERAAEVLIQQDGKIVVVGSIGDDDHFALARYNLDGSLDASFGSGGKVTTDLGLPAAARAGAIQADGRIVAAGTGGSDFVVAQYNLDGSLDASFGSGGVAMTDFGGFEPVSDVTIQPDGKIVAVGNQNPTDTDEYDFAIARYHDDGSLDTSFDSDGRVLTDFGAFDWARAVAIQRDGKIVAAGVSGGRFHAVEKRTT